MKKWNVAEIVELNITETAYGRNEHAKEANANKNPNNGAGGKEGDSSETIIPSIPLIPLTPATPVEGIS